MTDLRVTVDASHRRYRRNDPVELSYTIRNESGQEVYVVDDEPFVVPVPPDAYEVILGVPPRFEGMWYYHFQPPDRTRIDPGDTIEATDSVDLPWTTYRSDDDLELTEVEMDLPGHVDVELVVGYGVEDFVPAGSEASWEAFVDWQTLERADPVRVELVG